jgi:hypothetical protein
MVELDVYPLRWHAISRRDGDIHDLVPTFDSTGEGATGDAASATPGALTPRTGGSTPLDGATPRDSPRPAFFQ